MTESLKLAMNSFLILSLAIALTTPAYATTFFYSFKCKSNDDNSTMTHESSLEQSNGKHEGNTLGYQAGSFSYLLKGRIAFKDMFGYQEGQNQDPGRSRYQDEAGIFHNMNVSFEGAKGISEFYARGSFSDSWIISTKNAIRFEEFGSNFPQYWDNNFGTNYSAKRINVNADAIMGNGRRKDFSYDFLYNATVANGVVETKRIMRLPSQDRGRLSWEQNSLMKGNITLADHLLASNFLNRN